MMSPLREWPRRARAWFRRSESESALADEMRFHIEMEAASLERQGRTHDDAAAEARRRFGNVDRYTEELRDQRGGRTMDAFLQDLRYAFRMVRRAPGFAAIVIITLALAIGGTTAVFSVVNAVILRPLNFDRPGELVRVFAQNPDASQPRFGVSYADFADWQRMNRTLGGLALFGNTVLTMAGDGEPERLTALVASSNFFDVLGQRPMIGRLFGREDSIPNASATVVLTHGFWKRRFGGDSTIVGRSVEFTGRVRVVSGVLPPTFEFDGRPIDAIIVLAPGGVPGGAQNHGQHLFETIGRLRPGVALASAQQDIRDVAARVAADHPEIKGWSANVFRLQDELVRTTRQPLLILLGASVLVLLIGCINVANLITVRAAARTREVVLRQALGASRVRLVSQLLIESGVLAMIGGLIGVVLAVAGTKMLFTVVPAGVLPRFTGNGIDARVLVFAGFVSLAVALLVGVIPARRAAGANAAHTLREGGRSSTSGSRALRLRRAMVVTEMSVALVLLVCSALVLQSLYHIMSIDPGFRSERVSTMRLSLSGAKYPNDTAQIAFYRQFLTALSQRPGIEAASAANTNPISAGGITSPIRLAGKPVTEGAPQLMSPMTAVAPGYFATMGMTVLRGRDVAWSDPVPVLLASEAAAKRLWPGEDPIGKRVLFGAGGDGLEVVGVVNDAHARGLASDQPAMLYMAYSGAASVARTMSVVVRGARGTDVVATTKSVLREIDPALPVYNISTVDDVVAQSVAQPRLNTTLLTVFATLALILAAIGTYGVISFSVTQRVQEFGVRMALGARRADVLRLVLREGLSLAAIAIVIGAAGAIAATMAIRSWLFGVGRGDPVTFVLTAAMLAGVAVIATIVPALRATRVDPVMAMRGD